MGKKTKREPPPPVQQLAHNPFGALAGLSAPPGESLPEAPSEPVAQPADTGLPWPPTVVVRREKKGRGGKTVTRIAGVSRDHLPELARQLKRDLGCGAVVEDADLVLLGSLVERAAAWLEAAGAPRVVRGN